MKYPIEIEQRIAQIEEIISNWPIKKSLEEVVHWLLQFDIEDFDLAYRIIENMNIIGPEELNGALSISYSKLMRHAKNKKINLSLKNTMYAAIGGASKSGAMIAYNFRLINELSSANFLDEDSIKYIQQGKIENLVLVDDIIATGNQSSKDLNETAERVIPLGIKNIFVLTAVGFKLGLKKVQDTGLAEVFSAYEYSEMDSVNSLDSKFYDGLNYSERKKYFEKFSQYKGLGYEKVGGLIAFYYNTPNCTINSIWNNAHGWLPLFPRVSNSNGIDKIYPELENALSETAKSESNIGNGFTIFVEGKVDEIFFQTLAERFDSFGFEKFEVISIGPFYSKKLISSLDKISASHVLISEKESKQTAHSKRIAKVVDKDLLLLIDPIISYFEIEKIFSHDFFRDTLDVMKFLFDEDAEVETYLEMKLMKNTSSYKRQENIEQLVKYCLNEKKAIQLIEKIKARTTKK